MDLMEAPKIGLSGELGEGSQLPEESKSQEEGRMVQVRAGDGNRKKGPRVGQGGGEYCTYFLKPSVLIVFPQSQFQQWYTAKIALMVVSDS
jgi:hypothetical protein